MSRTVTLDSVKITSIVVNQIKENVGEESKDTGFSSAISYEVLDSSNKQVMTPASQKYTSGTSFGHEQKMSAKAEKIVTNFWNEMTNLMKEREEL
jgi:hypothetical protein